MPKFVCCVGLVLLVGCGSGATTGDGGVDAVAVADAVLLADAAAGTDAGTPGDGADGASAQSRCVDPAFHQVTTETQFIGPSGRPPGGAAMLPGEFMSVVFQGAAADWPRSFDKGFETGGRPDAGQTSSVVGHGNDGVLEIALSDVHVGVYECGPGVRLTYRNQSPGPLEFNVMSAAGPPDFGCCRVEIFQAGDEGEFIEGTFSGTLIGGFREWVGVTNGKFRVVRRPH